MSANSVIKDTVLMFENGVDRLSPYKDLISKESFYRFENLKRSFEADANAKMNENRVLRIGIVGQVNRGKSSFLNALLFDGKEVLPKSATPMTAALTKIRYSQNLYAKILFYTEADWKSIEQVAKEAKEIKDSGEVLNEEERACLEIYQKADSSLLKKLGEVENITGVSRLEDLLDRLKDFVGANGRFTPIVKSLELGVDIDSIKDIEIVDTPGMNDPVVSRGRVTQEFIGQCDVVFLLSISSQFLDENDVQLLAQNMPQRGVENIYLIASMFDSVMLDEFTKYEDAGSLITNLKHKLSLRAKDELQDSVRVDESIRKVLLNALPPIFVSVMCYNIAKHFDRLDESEEKVLSNLNGMYGDNFDIDDLLYIANIDEAKEKIEEVRRKKDEILRDAFEKVVVNSKRHFKELIEKILNETKANLEMLQNNDVAMLEKKQKSIQKSLKKGETKIDNLFERYIIDIEKKFADLLFEFKDASRVAGNVEVKTESYTETYTEKVEQDGVLGSLKRGAGSLFGQDDWGYDTKTRTKTVTYKYANVYEAIEQLENFVIESEKSLNETVKNIIDIDSFRKNILKNIEGLFDLSDDDFDPSDIVDTLKNSVERISIPNGVDIDTTTHIETIRENFSSSEVRDDKIDSLKREVKRVLKLILEDIQKEVEMQTKKIVSDLNEAKENFLPKLLQDSLEKLEKMKADREKLEEVQGRYGELIGVLEKM